MRPLLETLLLLTLCSIGFTSMNAQGSGAIPMVVTYTTSRQVYFDAGNEQGVSVGDTVVVSRKGQPAVKVVITAVASHSSVGRALSPQAGINAGDRGSISKNSGAATEEAAVTGTVVHESGTASLSPPEAVELRGPENVLTGRIGFQFMGEWADDSRLNVAQPAVVANVRLWNLLGTGMALSFSGREYYELTDAYARYGDSVRSRFDMYQFQLERDRPGDWFGFSAGRMVSRYVSGLGTFDGGQFFLRHGAFTSGALVGKGIQGRALGIGGNDTRTAVFAGFRTGDRLMWNSDAAIAYARQTVDGNLDRSFVYLQGSASLGPEISVFGNAEVDLNEINNGQRVAATRLSSAMLYFHYYPARWLIASMGYDATRSVYLFETMKSIPDSLFNESLRHAFRAQATLRPMPGISLTGMASFGTRKGDPRNTRTLSGSVRLLNLFGSGIHAGARYVGTVNVYLDGTDFTCEVERFFLAKVDLLLRYDVYSYSVAGLGHSYKTHTLSANLNWYISRSLYSTARGDYIIDDTVNSMRIFVELGVRF